VTHTSKTARIIKGDIIIYSDVNKARTLKAKAKAMAMAIPMQRLTMKYEVMKSCFFEYSYKDTSTA